ncbi:DUF11 domain-containing protein [Paenibacillus sp. CC-CFT747]|nr:DUF11 domain-containing protein [Paenibacillus sp. CC-CFT747]
MTITVTATGTINGITNSMTDTFALTITGAPDLRVSKSHTGDFRQGQEGATYTIVVSNSGQIPSSGVVTVTDALPSGLTATAMSGAGWTCSLSPLSCTRSDALAPGGTYPVTLTVNVAGDAPGTLVNTAAVSGGGETNTGNNTATDSATVVSLPQIVFGTNGAEAWSKTAGSVVTVTAGEAAA